MTYYRAAEEFVKDSFAAVGNQLVPLHLKRTVEWLIKLYPNSDQALLIAGVSHDIERAFREDHVYQKMFLSDNAFNDPAFLDYHQQRSAKIICDFLKTRNCPSELNKKIYHLVAHHETGGDVETDQLKDADSLSFFQTNVDLFVTVKVYESSIDKVKSKFTWMFERISDHKAREFCRPLYESAMTRLDQLEN
ncbi:MAG: hypothetical protein KAG92_05795 [Deltaproteobacteria bacterium]|nr:hypothetical protein [Deltaproteobacteria bacterium]